jgi:hypothetical protein
MFYWLVELVRNKGFQMNVMTCSECNKVAKSGKNVVRDFYGNTFAVCCDDCYSIARKLLDKLFIQFGGIKGKCSCYHSPKVESLQHLKILIN